MIIKKKWLRSFEILLIISSIVIGLWIINDQFKKNINFFYYPSEVKLICSDKIFRIGGIVKKNSLSSNQFVVTDYETDISVEYNIITPALFGEGKGVVSKGKYDCERDVFVATEILAKHDEKYRSKNRQNK